MNTFKKTILGAALAVVSSGAFAAPMNVGGVIWDPEAGSDFSATTNMFESFATGVGAFVTGYGEINQVNGQNQNVFCPGCELTYTFSYQMLSATSNAVVYDTNSNSTLFGSFTQSWNGTSVVTSASGPIVNLGAGDLTSIFSNLNSNFSTFAFGNGSMDIFVDSTPDFDANAPTMASASDGISFLHSVQNGLITGNATNLFNLDLINGQGSGFLDAVSGLAFYNFNTNFYSSANNADLQFTSSFQKNVSAQEQGFPLTGSVTLNGNTIPEPTSLALLGMGLLGFGASRMKKQA